MTASAQANTAGTSYYSATYCMLEKEFAEKVVVGTLYEHH